MKKFLIKSSYFVLPFFILYIVNLFFYDFYEGELARMGYFYHNPSPMSEVNNRFSLPHCITHISKKSIMQKKHYDLVVIGDSFSGQGNKGYKSFICAQGYDVLYIDSSISHKNAIQTIIKFLNSGLFDQISADYIIAEYGERIFLEKMKKVDFNEVYNLDGLPDESTNHIYYESKQKIKFFSNATVKALLTNILYKFQNKPFTTKTYQASLDNDNNLFTNNPKKLFYYKDDVKNMKSKSDEAQILKSIDIIEKVSDLTEEKDIKLIFMIAPDKYDLYYDYIKNKKNIPKPTFFDFYNKQPKNYVNVEAYEILKQELPNKKDLYFYDGTHWSPVGAELVANEIIKVMNKEKLSKAKH